MSNTKEEQNNSYLTKKQFLKLQHWFDTLRFCFLEEYRIKVLCCTTKEELDSLSEEIDEVHYTLTYREHDEKAKKSLTNDYNFLLKDIVFKYKTIKVSTA